MSDPKAEVQMTPANEIARAEKRGYLACMEQTQKLLSDIAGRQAPPPIVIQYDAAKDKVIDRLREALRRLQELQCSRDCETWTNGHRAHSEDCDQARAALDSGKEQPK